MNTNIRLLSLEYLRFFAAWNIFFGHYISFYIQFDLPYEDGIFPKFLFPYAGLSVPMFFMMSGAIFVHNYYDLISQKAINFQNYFQKRLARLYPLHFLTLLIMAVLQFYYLKLSGDYFVYPFNDLKHFILHLFFASHWGLEDGHSYNSVVWSVSHEIILYFLFFLVCFFLVNKINNKLGLFLGIFLVLFILNFLFGKVLLKSIGAFFIGSLIYSLVEYFQKFDQKKKIYVSIGTLIIFGILNKIFKYCGLPFGSLGPITLFLLLNFDFLKISYPLIFEKFGIFLGNLSYSTYLIHIPVCTVMALIHLKVYQFNFLEIMPLLIYVSVVFILSYFSYTFFENPLRRYLSPKKIK